jgi:hypothetical protein
LCCFDFPIFRGENSREERWRDSGSVTWVVTDVANTDTQIFLFKIGAVVFLLPWQGRNNLEDSETKPDYCEVREMYMRIWRLFWFNSVSSGLNIRMCYLNLIAMWFNVSHIAVSWSSQGKHCNQRGTFILL